MAKIVTVNRRHITILLSALIVCIFIFTAISYWQSNALNANTTTVVPEVKMVNVTLSPASIKKDMTYGSVTLKGVQVIPAKTFDLTVTLQNTTAQKLENIPLELTYFIVGDMNQKMIKPGTLQSLEPGASAKVTFRGIKSLGDASGINAGAGLHEIVLRVKSNPQGGINQTTEASYQFLIDSTVKAS